MENIRAREKSCCFTGHRIIRVRDMQKLPADLEEEIRRLYCERGITDFISGGAIGFDMLAGETVIKLRSELPDIKLRLMLPCINQDVKWNAGEKAQYRKLLDEADSVEYINREYHPLCMQSRNRAMVDASVHCIAYIYKNFGGAAYTVKYANEQDIGLTLL